MSENFKVLGIEIEGSEVVLSNGQTAERPDPARKGMFFLNNETESLDFYTGSDWVSIAVAPPPIDNTLQMQALKTGSFQATSGNLYPTWPGTADRKFILPADPTPGDRIAFFDIGGSWFEQYPSVMASHNINGKTQQIKLTQDYGAVEFIFMDVLGWFQLRGIQDDDRSMKRWKVLDSNTAYNLEPGHGHLVDNRTSAKRLNLPQTVTRSGQRIVIVHHEGTIGANVIELQPGSSKLNGVSENMIYTEPGSVVELVGYEIGGEAHWFTTFNTAVVSGASVPLSETDLTGLGGQLATGKIHFVDASAGVSDSLMPKSPKEGDEVWVIDKHGEFHINQHSLKMATSGEYIDGKSAPYVLDKKFTVANLVYSGTTNPGWIFKSTSRFKINNDYRKTSGISGDITPDFTDSVKARKYTITGNTNILDIAAQETELVSFVIVLQQSAIGGHSISVPSSWNLASGSPGFNINPSGTSIIQGIKLGQDVYYSVTNYD